MVINTMSKQIALRNDLIIMLDEIRTNLKESGKDNSYSDAIDQIKAHKKGK